MLIQSEQILLPSEWMLLLLAMKQLLWETMLLRLALFLRLWGIIPWLRKWRLLLLAHLQKLMGRKVLV